MESSILVYYCGMTICSSDHEKNSNLYRKSEEKGQEMESESRWWRV